ncbi:MAG TPA: diguanylate cyclase [Clostridium sp.]|nr:diguanylate cyclase [Clostridium sp.]
MENIVRHSDGKLNLVSSRKQNSLKKSFMHFIEHYLNTVFRKIEFLLFSLIAFSFSIIQILLSPNTEHNLRGFITNVQSSILFVLAFRFGYFGLIIAGFVLAFDIAVMFIIYYGLGMIPWGILGLSLKVSTGIISIFVAILSYRQDVQKKKLEMLAITDELTGAYNQRFFHSILDEQMQKVKKTHSSLGLMIIDIDDFKMYNDIYGHSFGDIILKDTVLVLRSLVEEEKAYVCRYGGDEFAIIISGENLKSLEKKVKRIQKDFEQRKSLYYKSDLYDKLTLSIGFSEYPTKANSKDELIYQADMALYNAKNLGKDRVHLYKDAILQIRKHISSNHQQLIGIFKGLLSTISAKDKYTLGHCERVSTYVVMIAEAMELDIKEVCIIQYAALLHDIGKIEIPKFILNKKEPLAKEELDLLRQHPVYSQNILEPLEGMDKLTDYVRYHHERYDGSGYPDGLAGEEISLGARILCVADSFDAMISERPYSKKMTMEQALKELEKNAGTQFDPKIVKIFLDIMKKKNS